MRKASYIFWTVATLLLFSCKERNYSLNSKYNALIDFSETADKIYYSKISGRVYLDSASFKDREDISSLKLIVPVNYEILFREYKAIQNNVVEISSANRDVIANEFDYFPTDGYYQKLYLKEIDTINGGKRSFLLSSLKFNANNQVCAIGKQYLGYLEKCYTYTKNSSKYIYRITFTHKLDYKKRSASFRQVKETSPVMFLFSSEDYENNNTDSTLTIHTILQEGDNKIGGAKALAYPVEEIMGNPNAFRFTKKTKHKK